MHMFKGKPRRGGDICAIVVHAGAGFHSTQNEHVHLQACNDACQAAMAVLKNGGSAVQAVEIAIKVLEDREITNAGYGSNLSMDGVVECDAVIVDHGGRSGGVGAVAQVKNPISVARLVLQHSTEELSLRRVPPNLLVSQGATDFAYSHGIPVLPYDALVSPAAKDRWLRWRHDLKTAEKRLRRQNLTVNASNLIKHPVPNPTDIESKINREREKHTDALKGKNRKPVKTQPSTPTSGSPTLMSSSPLLATPSSGATDTSSEMSDPDAFIDPVGPPGSIHESSVSAFINSTQNIPTLLTLSTTDRVETFMPPIGLPSGMDVDITDSSWDVRYRHDGSGEDDPEDSDIASSNSTLKLPSLTPSPPETTSAGPFGEPANTILGRHLSKVLQDLAAGVPLPRSEAQTPSPTFPTPLQRVHEHLPLPPSPEIRRLSSEDEQQPAPPPTTPELSRLSSEDGNLDQSDYPEDLITDTVGAIAIDMNGNIACGASSGGIGMKYRGRVGPAALVGVGAAVVPSASGDNKNQKCISTVTSGTGEHMGTTFAASTCAERLYHEVQKSLSTGAFERIDETEVLKAFIERDFMAHPSVQGSTSAGAIGLVSVKKTLNGAWLYFAHNTDSFALASMSSEDSEPQCTMSRNQSNGSIAHGARSLGYKVPTKSRRSRN